MRSLLLLTLALTGCPEIVEVGTVCSTAAQCSDGVFCNGAEVCVPGAPGADERGCALGPAPDLTSDNPCVTRVCDEQRDLIDDVRTPQCSACATDAHCEAAQGDCAAARCAAGQCVVDIAQGASCDDGVACTDEDICDANGACVGFPNQGACIDDLFCNGLESCQPDHEDADVRGCVAGRSPEAEDDGIECTASICNESEMSVAQMPTDACGCDTPGEACREPDGCNVYVCTADFLCEPRPAPGGTSCDDGFDCTVSDVCNDSGRCLGTAEAERCDDGLYCNGVEACEPTDPDASAAGCTAGVTPSVPDGLACTDDICNEDTDAFDYVPGDDCGCAVDADCIPDERNPCLDYACGDDLICAATPSEAGTACDDGYACTPSSGCDGGGRCLGEPDHDACVDLFYCNGLEACAPHLPRADARGCVANAPPEESDGIGCTDDVCVECDPDSEGCRPGHGGAIEHRPTDACECSVDSDCDPNRACMVGLCDDNFNCRAGIAPAGTACDDGIDCTSETECDSQQNCVGGARDHEQCSDGLYCTGNEVCAPEAADPEAPLDEGCAYGPSPVALHPDQRTCVDLSCVEEDEQVIADDERCGECVDVTIYGDVDEDGYGNDDDPMLACLLPDEDVDGWAREGGDCGHLDPVRYPGAEETCGDWLDDDCDGEDARCPTSRPGDLDNPDWTCGDPNPPDNVLAWVHFPTGGTFFREASCFVIFEGLRGEYYVRKDGFTPVRSGYTCPTPDNGFAYDERMYAHLVSGPVTSCPPIDLIVHGPDEDAQVVSNDCRKYLFQMTSRQTLSFLGGDLDAVRERLALFDDVEISCSAYDGFWAEFYPHGRLLQAPVVTNTGYEAL
jgi:hypothetical protein